MKIICIKKHFKNAVQFVEKITNKNLNLQILSAVLISTNNNSLIFTATNLEIGIKVIIPAKVVKNGSVAVPAGILSNFLANFSFDENINIETIKNNLVVSTKNSSTTINGFPVKDFPSLPEINEKKSFKLSVAEFINALKSVYYSASLSTIKPEISSVYIYSKNNYPLTVVATDSFRLAEKTLKQKFSDFTPVIVPYRNIVEIIRVFENQEGNIKIIFDKNQIMLSTDNIKLISRVTEGVYPDYKQLIPKKFTTTVLMDKTELNNALKTAGVFSGKLNGVVFNVKSKENILEIKTTNGDIGEYNTTIPVDVNGEGLVVSFNYKYIFDCMMYLNSEKINLKFNGQNKPMVITNANNNSFQYLVMPMNT